MYEWHSGDKMICLFRSELDLENEREVAANYVTTVDYRSQVPANSVVIGRYSVLPYYRELERELAITGSRLVNTWREHSFIADALAWSGVGGVLRGMTPHSWPTWAGLPEGAYVVKGRTNSRKSKWNTHMFAPTLEDVPKVAQRLWDDALISEQGLVVREYIPLRQFDEGLNGLPITNEWRTFWLALDNANPRLLAKGFYWTTHPDAEVVAEFTAEALMLGEKAARRIAPFAKFFVLDLAETASGEWIVVEVNDGQMAGLTGVSADDLWKALSC